MVVKIVKKYSPKKGPKRKPGTVCLNIVKDQSGMETKINLWDKLIDQANEGDVVCLTNLELEDYPKDKKPHVISTTKKSSVKSVKQEELKNVFQSIFYYDGKAEGIVEAFYNVYRYTACSNCTRSIQSKFCKFCKKVVDVFPGIKYGLCIEDAQGLNYEFVGFKDTLGPFLESNGLDIPPENDNFEDFLNEKFEKSQLIVEWREKWDEKNKNMSKIVYNVKFSD